MLAGVLQRVRDIFEEPAPEAEKKVVVVKVVGEEAPRTFDPEEWAGQLGEGFEWEPVPGSDKEVAVWDGQSVEPLNTKAMNLLQKPDVRGKVYLVERSAGLALPAKKKKKKAPKKRASPPQVRRSSRVKRRRKIND